MHRKIIRVTNILLVVIMTFTQLFAQEGMVQYRYILNLDTTLYQKNTEGIPAFLYFSPQKSLFAFDRFKDTIFITRSTQETTLSDGSVINYEERDEYGNMFYKDFTTAKLSMRRLLFKEAFIAEEPLPAINWNLLTETKTINGIMCKKAITLFRGRYYEAWFAPSIPVSDGPWKLHGLPGLILEAYDRNKEIQYLFDSIKFPYSVTDAITVPKKGTPISLQAFQNIEQTQADKIVKMIKTSMNRKEEVDVQIKIFPIEK